jgi:predicted DNA-binding transcriptional regulator YafY
MLQSGGGQNANRLAKVCGVSRRTVFRDLEALRIAGVPLEFDAALDRYSIPSTYYLPPVNFTAAEALSLMVMAGEMGRNGQLPFFESAHAATLKLEGSLPPTLRDEVRDLSRSIRIRPNVISQLQSKQYYYQQLVDARRDRHVVRIKYDSKTEWEQIVTKLRPYHLLFSRHSWYVIGRSSLHREVRTFNLSRIVELTVLAERFRLPRGFSIERHLGNAWRLIPSPEADYHVLIRFQPLVAANVAEVHWHRTQRTEFQNDGSLLFRVTVSGLHEIVWWVLGYGDQAEVLQPLKLRRLVTQRAKNMLARYITKEAV